MRRRDDVYVFFSLVKFGRSILVFLYVVVFLVFIVSVVILYLGDFGLVFNFYEFFFCI